MAPKNPTINAAVRMGGRVYLPGDSTDRSINPGRGRSIDERIAARKLQARAELAQGGEGGEGGDPADPTTATLAELAGVLDGMTDVDEIRKAKRRDPRAGSKSLYDARIQAIKDAEGGAEGGDEGEGAE
jgi:hypothetical protein